MIKEMFDLPSIYGKNHIQFLCGEVIDVLKTLPDRSVHCVVTSPPYFRLRNYEHELQIGMEDTPEEFIDKLVNVFREVRRVLRDDGTLWINIGDSYAGSGKSGSTENNRRTHRQFNKVEHSCRQVAPTKATKADKTHAPGNRISGDLKGKDMIGVPWMLAFALRNDGWYLRSDIIWAKKQYTPESVKDRPTKSYEHIFMFAKSRNYYYDLDAIRQPIREGNTGKLIVTRFNAQHLEPGIKYPKANLEYEDIKGANERDVWSIGLEPSRDEHYAPFPTEIPRKIIKASTPQYGCCSICGAPYIRDVVVIKSPREKTEGNFSDRGIPRTTVGLDSPHPPHKRYENGWKQNCECTNSEPVPATVLDPFGGSCTTGAVAAELSRNAIMIDIKDEYLKIGHNRLKKLGYQKLIQNIVYIS